MNKPIDFAGLRIYGLLTDLNQFKFYSYDPATKQFYFDDNIIVNNKRTQVLSDMMNGTYISLQQLTADFFPQFPIRSLVLFCQLI